MERIQPVLGLIVMVVLLILFSSNRRAIRWRVLVWGMGLQLLLARFVLKVPFGHQLFQGLNAGFIKVIEATESGATFVLGPMAASDYVPVGEWDE